MQENPDKRAHRITMAEWLDVLCELVPPPAEPVAGDRSWDWLFEQLGHELPSDYVALMETYGPGTWLGWLRFYQPLREDGLVAHATEDRFLPFAETADGKLLGWITELPPQDVPDAYSWGEQDGWWLGYDGITLPFSVITVLLNWARDYPTVPLPPRTEKTFVPG